MQPYTDQPTDQSHDQSTADRRVTVPEAARILGISPEAVRARIHRGTLPKEKTPDGRVYVRLDEDQPGSNGGRTTDQSTVQATDRTHLIASLEEQVSFLRSELVTRNEELRRKDHIIAALTERIMPELEATPEPREAPETAAAGGGRGYDIVPSGAQKPVQRRSWLYRFFFGT